MAEPTNRACDACGGALLREKDWIFRCPSCGFFASTLRPGDGTGIQGLETLRRRNFEVMLNHLEKHRTLVGLRLLEVGSAWGWFLEAARQRGAQVRGIEPEVANARLARAAGFDIEVGFFPGDLADPGPYDAIVFNDVFEHLPDPPAAVRAVEHLLAPGGLLIINLPSSDGILFHIARTLDRVGSSGWIERLWQKGFPSPHVSYFNRRNLRLLVERHSFLRLTDAFSLSSVIRDGLVARISSSHRGPAGWAAIAGVWTLSFALPLLPADISVSMFVKPR